MKQELIFISEFVCLLFHIFRHFGIWKEGDVAWSYWISLCSSWDQGIRWEINNFVNSICNQRWFASGWFSEKQNLQSYPSQSEITMRQFCLMGSRLDEIQDNTMQHFPEQKAWFIVPNNGRIGGSCSEAALPVLLSGGSLLSTENTCCSIINSSQTSSKAAATVTSSASPCLISPMCFQACVCFF